MAITFTNFVSWDMQSVDVDLNESKADGGVSFETTVKKHGFASIKLGPRTGAIHFVDVPLAVSPAVYAKFHFFGMWFRMDTIPTSDVIVMARTSDFFINYTLEVVTGGDLLFVDTNGTTRATLSGVISVDTWHFIEWRVEDESDNASGRVWVDGVGQSFTGADTKAGLGESKTDVIKIQGPSEAVDLNYVDNIYIGMDTTAHVNADRIGDTFKIISYSPGNAGTETGDALDVGEWRDTGDAPPDSPFDDAAYTGILSGEVRFNGDGTGRLNSGPSGGPTVTTILGAQWWHILKFANAGKTINISIRYGNSVDGVTATGITITEDFIGYGRIQQAGDTEVPLASEFFVSGMGTATVTDVVMKDQYAWLAMYDPTVGATIPLMYHHYSKNIGAR